MILICCDTNKIIYKNNVKKYFKHIIIKDNIYIYIYIYISIAIFHVIEWVLLVIENILWLKVKTLTSISQECTLVN